MKIIKEEKKYLVLLFCGITVISLMCFLPSLIEGVPITFGTDIKPQWFEFYTEFKNLILNFINHRQIPVYSWNLFLGNNFWASKSYYLIGDIYNYIGLLMDDNFFDVARNLSYLKFLVAGFSFYFYMAEAGRKPLSKLVVSLAYAFSGWAIFFSGQLVFLSFYSFIPLYLWGLERCLHKKSPWLFILSCSLLFATNFYFFYTVTIFSPIYYIYRYIILDLDRKDFWRSVFKQISFYLVGIMITAVIWLPGVIYILGSNRFGQEEMSFDLAVYLNYFFSSFVPNYLYIYRNNAFETSVHYTREICMWASSALIILVPQFCHVFDKKEKNLTLAMYILFTIIACVPVLDSMMHGFGDPSLRWVFLIVIFNLYVISKVIDNIEKIDKKKLCLSTITMIVFVVLLFVIAIFSRGENVKDYIKQACIILVSILVMIISLVLVINRKIKCLLVLVVLELGFSGMYCYGQDVRSKPDDTYEYMDDLTSVIQYYPNEIMETINGLSDGNDREFIRLYIPIDSIYWNFSHNMSLHYGIKGLMTYDSTYANSFASMYHMDDVVSSFGSGWIFNIEDDNLMSFLNTKYAIVTSADEMGENWIMVDDDYHYGFKIYENIDYRPLGTTYTKIMKEEEYVKGNTGLFLDHVIVKDNYDEIKSYLSDAKGYMFDINYYGNYLSAKYESDKDGFMVMTIPYDKGWNILVDGEKIDYFMCNGGFIGFRVNEGVHGVQMSFIPQGLKTGLILSTIGIISFIGLVIYSVKKNLNKNQKSNQIN